MPQALVTQLQRMCAHDIGATVKLLGAVHGVPNPPPAALEKLAHTVLTIELWLHRLGAFPEKPANIFPKNPELHAVAQHAELAGRAWSAYCEGLTDSECARVVEYTTVAGDAARSTVADILTHMSLHGQYHRGQAALLLKDHLPMPVATDFIYFSRGKW